MTCRTAIALFPLLVLGACKKDGEGALPFDEAGGLLGDGIGNPFPNAQLVGADGKLALDPADFPLGSVVTGHAFPADLANHRTGFSPVQVSTLRLDGIDCGECPPWRNPTPGEGSVLLVDVTSRTFLPVMAELDAYEPNDEAPALLVRPQTAIPYGHQVAVVVTVDAVARPERFDTLISGGFDTTWGDHYADIVDLIDSMGIPEDRIALVWDFPVGDGTQPTRSAVAQADPPGGWTIQFRKEADNGDSTPPSIWRQAQGTIDVVNFIGGDARLDMDPTTGEVAVTGESTENIAIAIPHSVKDAPAGSVPILIYGHGIFTTTQNDIYASTGDWAPFSIASDLGMIIVAADWGGLDGNDALIAISVATDMSNFPNLSSKLVQGQASHQALLRLLQGGAFVGDDVFTGASGQSLPDPDQIYFWGVSMGGILGGVAAAQEGAPYKAVALQMGGGGWSSLLERSSAWTEFEGLVSTAVPSAGDRQVLYAASQLFWDPVDPIAYVDDLADDLILLQEATNDDTVHNMSTRMYARSLGLTLLEPSVDEPWGMAPLPADLPAGSRALVQFDPGTEPPPNKNRPAPVTGAHFRTVSWWETWTQSEAFLRPGQEGTVEHYCGDAACSLDNRG